MSGLLIGADGKWLRIGSVRFLINGNTWWWRNAEEKLLSSTCLSVFFLPEEDVRTEGDCLPMHSVHRD